MQIPYRYIAIEGVIGVGKTSLATKIAHDFDGRLILESFEENPFLAKFYANQDKYAFPVELSFLAERFQQLNEQFFAPDLFHDFVVSDYITEKSLIFAGKTLSEDLFSLYSKLFHIIFARLPKPEILVYLYASPENLKEKICRRGRESEKKIDLDYLDKIQKGYLDFIQTLPDWRVLIIDVNNLDFVHRPDDYRRLTDLIFQPYEIGIHRFNA